MEDFKILNFLISSIQSCLMRVEGFQLSVDSNLHPEKKLVISVYSRLTACCFQINWEQWLRLALSQACLSGNSLKNLYSLQSYYYTMACLIQLRSPSFIFTAPGHQPEPCAPPPIDRSLLKSKIQQLFTDFYTPLIQFIGPDSQNFHVHFLVPFLQNFQLFFQFQLSASGQLRKIKFKLRKEGHLTLVTYSQAIRSFCRTMTKFNNAPASLPFTFGIDLKNGQIGAKAAFKGITLSNQVLLTLIKRMVAEAQTSMQDFVSCFLYNHSTKGLKFVKKYGSQEINQSLFGRQGQFKLHQGMKELLPFLNSDLEGKEKTDANEAKKYFPSLNNPLEIMELRSNQHKRILTENILFASHNCRQEDQQNTMAFNQETLKSQLQIGSNAKNSEPLPVRNINIVGELKEREKVLKAGPKARVSVNWVKFKEVNNRDANTTDPQPKDQLLVMKQSARKNDIAKEMAIRYERQIFQQLSSSYSTYLPIYYKSTSNAAYKDHLLMEFINGYTIHEVMQAKKYFLGMPSKLKLLAHLSNMLRFLDQKEVVHIDLSPNNILVSDDLSIRIIDFGQAYCSKVTAKYMNAGKNDGGFRYRPCKTFPFSSPEAYLRSSNFTSSQDMYSFGMVAFKILFGFNLMPLSQKSPEKLYKNKEYMQKMLFVPEMLNEYPSCEVLTILAYIIFRSLEVDQKTRPLATWVHLLIKRMFVTSNR